MKKNNNEFLKQIKSSFNKKKLKNTSFSWRLLAKQVGISHAFLSSILNDKKSFPIKRLDAFIKALDLDPLGCRKLLQAFIESEFNKMRSGSKKLKDYLDENTANQSKTPVIYDEVPSEKIELFQHWYFPVLLDLIETSNFIFNIDSIATKLGITAYEAKWAWNYLANAGLIKQDKSGKWKKVNAKLRMPMKGSSHQMRKFYKQLFSKATYLMENHIDEESFSNRIIMGVTCSANLKNWPKVKNQIEDQLYLNAENLSDGTCEQVYGLVTLAIPLTKI